MSKRPVIFGLLFLLLTSFPNSFASAQDLDRSGFFVGFGLGAGSFADREIEGRQNSGSGFLRFGIAFSEQLLVGAEIEAWSRDNNNFRITTAGSNLVAYFYASKNLYIKGGLGVATVEIDAGIEAARENGLSASFGAGYDIGLGQRFALSPYLSYQTSTYPNANQNLIYLGLGFTWY